MTEQEVLLILVQKKKKIPLTFGNNSVEQLETHEFLYCGLNAYVFF